MPQRPLSLHHGAPLGHYLYKDINIIKITGKALANLCPFPPGVWGLTTKDLTSVGKTVFSVL